VCLGIPGRITEIRDEAGLAMGMVDFGGVRKEVCLAYLPDAGPGDYVIVHVGFAISKVDEAEAKKTLEILESMGAIGPELKTMGPGMDEPAIVSDDEVSFDGAPPPAAVGGASS
jgi:hydrogenase expression/formation protein HypC